MATITYVTTPAELIERLTDLIADVETLQGEIDDEALDALEVPDVHGFDSEAPLSFALEDVFCRLSAMRRAVEAHANPPQVGRHYQVRRVLLNCHPQHTDYQLECGDVIAPTADGTWTKITAPGISGFVLKPSYLACLQLLPE